MNGGVVVGAGVADTDGLRDDAANLGGGVELALALAAFGGEVAHQVLVGVALGAVFREVEGFVFEDGDQVREAVHHLLAVPELVGVGKGAMIFLLICRRCRVCL